MKVAKPWREPPNMDAGAPEPAAFSDGHTLWIAYRQSEENQAEEFAVLKFSNVLSYSIGPPSDERLHEHPLYEAGLSFYSFHEAEGTSWTKQYGARGFRHWIITFHDETVEVVAQEAEVLAPGIVVNDSTAALLGEIEKGI